MTLRIVLNSDVFCPGETVEGRVHVTGGGGSRSLEVLLRFIEQSPDYRTVARTVSGAVFHSGELETGQVVDFSIELPADALPNASSEHAELYWELEVRSDELGLDSRARKAVEVVANRERAGLTA